MSQTDQVGVQMPRYRCHKEVWALKIKTIMLYQDERPDGPKFGGAEITPAEPGYASFFVYARYVAKHNPRAGGYYVVYDDGYKSWSPSEAFEAGYTRLTGSIRDKPTIAELDAILNSHDDRPITINPDGSIRVG